MTHKQIEMSRETRLWIGQIIVPAIVMATTIMVIPTVRETISKQFGNVKRSIKSKFVKRRNNEVNYTIR